MGKKRILVVDDEIDLVELVRLRLETKGYEVLTANNGLDGLSKAKRVHPDLMILDIAMEPMDGYTLLKEIRNSEEIKDTPVIMLTAHGKMEDLFKVEGVSDYIIKPFDPKDFLKRVAKILGEGNRGGETG